MPTTHARDETDTVTSASGETAPTRSHGSGAALGLLLGVAMGGANVLGYVMVLVLSRALGPADFGGYTALSTYGVILAIPAGAFQVIIARRLSRGLDGDAQRTSGLRPALAAGATLLGVTAVASPWLAASFHLSSPLTAVLAGAIIVPMLTTGCFQGLLLGDHRIRGLALLYVVTAGTRLIAAVVCAGMGWGVTQVFAAMLGAAIVTALCGAFMCRSRIAVLPATGVGMVAEMIRSNSTLAAYTVLTNVDVLLARHFLTPYESGGYALASSFGRAICWGTQFIALLIIPRMHGRDASRTLLGAGALVAGIGAAGFGVIAISPSWWITVAGGTEFGGFGGLALTFVALGIAWALAQIWLFSEMGSDTGRLGILTWAVVALEVAAIALLWHGSAAQIVAACACGALVIAITGLTLTIRRHRRGIRAPSRLVTTTS